ncbi:MAG: hypothetical protein Q9214_005272, partial [Letrouitia sp. 1 TL-2023]
TSAPVSAGDNQDNSSGLSPQSRIAVAVVVPIVAVALLVLAGLFLWRKRKQRKDAEELRRKEVEEYGFNPNNDPTLPTVGGASSNGDDPSEMKETDGAGYRGWGTTSTNRKPSTTLSSGNGGIGVARSGSGSDPGGYHAQGSPTAGTNQSSDVQSGDPLVANGRPLTADSETIGALGAAPAANGNRQDRDIHRGPSNASSAYSGAHRSDTSTDGIGASGQQYHNEGIYYDEGMPQHGPSKGKDEDDSRGLALARVGYEWQDWKFGKHLQKRQLDIAEYAASFVNYKALKKVASPWRSWIFFSQLTPSQLIKQLGTTPMLLAQNASDPSPEVADPRASLQANNATFFFRLERELEKVNAFYLQKEAEVSQHCYSTSSDLAKIRQLKLRLRTLLDKKRVLAARGVSISKTSANFITLEEGFQQFGNDLNKLQQFVDINATAFSKILKKSRTKELYLSRAVDVQPCFNRDVISELSDQATTSLLELGAWADGEGVRYGESRTSEHIISWQSVGNDQNDIDSQLLQAALPKDFVVLQDWVKRLRGSSDAKLRLTRTFLGAIADASEAALEILLESGLIDFHAEDEVNE